MGRDGGREGWVAGGGSSSSSSGLAQQVVVYFDGDGNSHVDLTWKRGQRRPFLKCHVQAERIDEHAY